MNTTRAGDLLIRQKPGVAGDVHEICDAKTFAVLSSHATLRDAIVAAQAVAVTRRIAVWQHMRDTRGRPVGPPVLLFPRLPRFHEVV
jgi:hypothetical protein